MEIHGYVTLAAIPRKHLYMRAEVAVRDQRCCPLRCAGVASGIAAHTNVCSRTNMPISFPLRYPAIRSKIFPLCGLLLPSSPKRHIRFRPQKHQRTNSSFQLPAVAVCWYTHPVSALTVPQSPGNIRAREGAASSAFPAYRQPPPLRHRHIALRGHQRLALRRGEEAKQLPRRGTFRLVCAYDGVVKLRVGGIPRWRWSRLWGQRRRWRAA